MLQTKYLVAAVAIALALLNALQVSIAGGIDNAEAVQLVVVGAGAGLSILVPLLSGPWAGVLKTGFAVLAAAGTALAPLLINGEVLPEQWVTVVIAGISAIAVQIGVTVRTDTVKAAAAVIDAGTAQAGLPVDITSLPAQTAIATLAADPAAAKVVLGASPTVTI